jgi:hypothetical protein
MANLIRVQWYRFWNYPLFRRMILVVCVAAMTFLPLMDTLPSAYPVYGFQVLIYCLNVPVFECIFVMPVLIHTVCSAFRSRAICHEQSAGYAPHQMLLSRLIVGGGIVLMFSMLAALGLTLFYTCKNGWEEYPLHDTRQAAYADYTMRWIMLALISLQAALFSILCSCITREPASALIFSWAIYGISLILYINILNIENEQLQYVLLTLLPGFQGSAFSWTASSSMPMMALSSFVFCILELLPLYVIACRRIASFRE